MDIRQDMYFEYYDEISEIAKTLRAFGITYFAHKVIDRVINYINRHEVIPTQSIRVKIRVIGGDIRPLYFKFRIRSPTKGS